jgi:glycosyltransferase involved in cell wall biosynthesis
VIERICVVVPVRDEAARLGACLRALRRAAEDPRLAGVAVELAVVLDACTDASEDVARAALAGVAGAAIVRCEHRSAGAARAAGAQELLDRRDGDRTWLATTDADSTVPPDWLAAQVALAAGGADAVVGTVALDGLDAWPRAVRERYAALYRDGGTGDGHRHAHGANLGVRADALAASGGLPELAQGEDHALVAGLAARGARIVRTGAVRVRTSARPDARAAGGLGALLRRLADADGD